MKKILLVLVVLLSVFFGYSQTPNGKSAPVGNAGLTQWNKGVSLSDSGYQFISVADTFVANRGWLKGIPGLLLRVADTLLYIRNQAMTRWVLVGSGGSIFPSPSVGGLFWNGSNYIWEGLIGDVTSTGNSTTLSTVNSNPGVYGDSTKTLIATVDSKGRISNITVKTISVGDTTIRGQVIPSLINGILRYTGSNWVFDPTSYATNANLSLKKDISDSLLNEGYTTRYKAQQDSIALQNQVNTTWSVAGNTGINSPSNFLGTIDNKSLVFKQHSIVSGYFDTAYNVGFGIGAGYYALDNPAHATYNTAIGVLAMRSGSGSQTQNIAIGQSSMDSSTGSYNVGIGSLALHSSFGTGNTSIGQSSTYGTTTGSYNVALGYGAAHNGMAGSYNIAQGYNAMYGGTTTGSYNVALGYGADSNTTNTTNSIALGTRAIAASNQLSLSDSIHLIKAAGLSTGAGYVLTDVLGNGNLSLQPAMSGTDTTIVAGYGLKSTVVSKVKTLVADTSIIQTVLNTSKGLIIGTSIDTTYPSANYRVDSFLITKTDSAVGNTVKMQARPGSTILQQESIYLADANKATYDWIDFRLGANDVGDTTTYPTTQSLVDAYQKFIDTVSATKKTSCKILLSAETPARSRYITLYGATVGPKIWTRLSQLNESVMGGTLGGVYTKITGVQYRENYGFTYLDDGNGNLAVPYDTSSLDAGIHPNNAGKKMMAYGLRKALNQMGFLKVRGENPPLPGVINSIPIYYGPNGYAGNQYLTFNTPSLPYGMNMTNPKSTGQSIYYSSNDLGTLGGVGMNGSTALVGTNSYYAGNYSVISQKGLIINAGTANSGGSNSFILMNVDGFSQPLNGLLLTKNNLRLFSNTVSGNSIAVSDTSTASGNNPSYILSSGGDSCIIFQNNLNAATYKIFSPRSLNVWKPNSGDINMLSEAGKIQFSGFGSSTPQIAITGSTTVKISASLAIVDGTQGSGKVFTSDASGNGSWGALSAIATLDFPSTAGGAKNDLTMTLTGAVIGDAVSIGIPAGSVPANGVFYGWVSATNTITIRYANNDLVTTYDPSSGVFKATIIR